MAAEYGHKDVVGLLVQVDANVDATNEVSLFFVILIIMIDMI